MLRAPALFFILVNGYCFSWGTRPSITDTHTHTHASNLIAKVRCLGMSRVFHETNVTSRGLVCAELSFVWLCSLCYSPSLLPWWCSCVGKMIIVYFWTVWSMLATFVLPIVLCPVCVLFDYYPMIISNGDFHQQSASSIGICR